MNGAIGIPELAISLVLLVFSVVPIAASVWALVVLYRIHAAQREILSRLDRMERATHAGIHPPTAG